METPPTNISSSSSEVSNQNMIENDPMDISAPSSEDSRENKNVNEGVDVVVIDVHDNIVITNYDKKAGSVETVNSSSNGSIGGDSKQTVFKHKKSSLLNTKSYLMNSLLHYDDKEKILAQLSKIRTLEPSSRNYYHGRLYNYVLPAPKINQNNQVLLPTIYNLQRKSWLV